MEAPAEGTRAAEGARETAPTRGEAEVVGSGPRGAWRGRLGHPHRRGGRAGHPDLQAKDGASRRLRPSPRRGPHGEGLASLTRDPEVSDAKRSIALCSAARGARSVEV